MSTTLHALVSFAIPLAVSVYSFLAVNLSPTIFGWVDHAAFSMLAGSLLAAVKFIRKPWLRTAVGSSLIIGLVFIFAGNVLYFRFFHSWIQFSHVARLPDLGPGLANLPTLLRWPDAVFAAILMPLIGWWFLRGKPAPQTILIASFVGTALLVIHHIGSSPSLVVSEQNPFFYPFRTNALQVDLAGQDMEDLSTEERRRFLPINQSLYRFGSDPEFPLVKHPIENTEPLPFQLPPKTNVILILLESVRAHEMGAYGANVSLTPRLDEVTRESILFSTFYSLSVITLRSEFSIHASFNPNVSRSSLYADNPDLRTFSLPEILERHGYDTHWFEADFGNGTKRKVEFLRRNGFDNFHTAVPRKNPPIGWGAADEDTFDYALDVLSRSKQPFFAEIMTLSNHWPWEAGFPTSGRTPRSGGSNAYRQYQDGVFYTDHAVGTFIERFKKSKLAGTTAVVITGDHAYMHLDHPKIADNPVVQREVGFRVPFMIWAPGLLAPGRLDTLGSHIDLAPTLLDLLGIRETNAFLGTSLLRDDVANRFVFFVHDNGWNLRTQDTFAYQTGAAVYDTVPPFDTGQLKQSVRGANREYVFFHATMPFLHEWKPHDISELTDENRRDLTAWGNRMAGFYSTLLSQNRLWPPKVGGGGGE